MKPHIHSRASARKYGGNPDDYQAIHDFIDSSKSALPDVRHRCVLHSAFGIYIVERVFGATIINSDGKEVSVRDIAEDHVIQDMGTIPTLETWLSEMPISAWMGGPSRKVKKFHYGSTTDVDPTQTPEYVD